MHSFKVPARAHQSSQGNWILTFDCPACGRIHRHGGGGKTLDPLAYDTRVPHCPDLHDRWGRRIFFAELKMRFDFNLRPADEATDFTAEARAANAFVLSEIDRLETAGSWEHVRRHVESIGAAL